MREGWRASNLGDVIEIQSGFSFKSSDYSDGGHFLIRIGNVQSGHLSLDKPKYVQLDSKTYRFELNEGDILTSLTGNIGRVAVVQKEHLPAALNQRVARLTLKNPNVVLREFLYYFLSSGSFSSELNKKSHGVAQKNVSPKAIAGIKISTPPLPEQKRIVAFLDEVFAGIDTAIANTEKNLDNARELFESYLNAVFSQRDKGWELKKLGEVTSVQSGGTPLRSKPEYWEGDIPWYSSGELNDLVATAPARYITETGLINSNAKIFLEGSLLIGMYDTAALKMAILDRKAAFNQAIAAAAPSDRLDLRFVYFAINAVKRSLLLQRRGVRQKNLSLDKIKKIEIPVPPLVVQRDVAESLLSLVNDLNRIHEIDQQKLTALAELKQSLLHKAFSGELTAREAEAAVEEATV